VRARALEDQIFVIGINTTGITPVDIYNGHSLVSGPEGEVIVRAGEEEGLLYAGIDATKVAEARRSLPFQEDRRPELYHRLLKKTDS